jgi:hypothetical protein
MMYVQRDESGTLVGVFANPQPGYAEEPLPDDHAEVATFFNRSRRPEVGHRAPAARGRQAGSGETGACSQSAAVRALVQPLT